MTSSASAKWADLVPRLASALVMLGVGGVAIWAGGGIFAILALVVAALMMWELAKMTRGAGFDASWLLAALAAVCLGLILWLPSPYWLVLLLLPPLVGAMSPRRDLAIFAPYALMILLCALALVLLRESHGVAALAWLLATVIASDVMGYFAGRVLGGPKFWPRVSPKKTWSGTIAGWIGAALVGLYFFYFQGWSAQVLWISPLIAFAGQMGDVAESAIKRRTGVKDSSNLIPGHGGFLDRFDAVIFASVLALILNIFLQFLPKAA